MELADIIATPVTWLLGAIVVALLIRGLPRRHSTWVALGYASHLGASIAQVLLTKYYFPGGDMLMYAFEGEWLSDLVRYDPARFLPEVLRVTFQQDYHLPGTIIGGGSTVSMAGIAALLFTITGGSLYASIALVAASSFIGKLLLYKELRGRWSATADFPLLAGLLLLPSCTYWSSGLLKESVAIGPLCAMAAVLGRALASFSLRSYVVLALCAVPIALTKPYILFAFIVSAAVMLYVQRGPRTGRAIRPVYFILGSLIAFAGLTWLGRLFPEYNVETLGESMAQHQAIGRVVSGGSNYSIGDPTQRSLAGQLAFAPIALVTSLFRPFFFEVHNAVSALAALEAILFSFLGVRVLAKRRLKDIAREVFASPYLAFSLAFTLAFALAVGLATTNMGTLSRYRMPLLPFWMTLLVVWNRDLFERRTTARATVPRQVRVRPTAPMARPVEPPRDT